LKEVSGEGGLKGPGKRGLKENDMVPSEGVEMKGPWEVSLHHVNGTARIVNMSSLEAIEKDFAGVVVYRGVFHLDRIDGRTWLDLGHLRDVTELEVNGRRVGVRWYGEHVYEISGVLVKGENYVTITLTTTLGNYMKTLKHNRAARAWTARSPYYTVGVEGVVVKKG